MSVRIAMSLILLLSLLLSGAYAAEEIRSPVCPVSFGSSPCIMSGTNSPGLLSDYEMIYLDTSNGYYLGADNFYYAGKNYKNSEIDLFSKRYHIVTINSMDAILTNDIYKNENNLQISTGKELDLKNGYSLVLSDIGEDNARFVLKRNNEILEIGTVYRNGLFSYDISVNGRGVEVFRTKLIGMFGNSAVIKDTYLRDIKVIKDGESFGVYEINLKDIDGDGYIDIVYSLKNKKISLPDNGITPILDNFLSLRTYPAYVPFYQSLEDLDIVGEDSRFRIYSLNHYLKMSVSSFLDSPPEDSIIAAGAPAGINTGARAIYKYSNTSINELRGDHTFYIYTKGNLRLTVKKQDLNWYIGSDALEIKLYSQANNLIKSITIPDDGNTGNNSRYGDFQYGTLEASLAEGVYKIVLTGKSGADFLIRSIELDNGNIVVQNPFLAGALYTGDKRFNLYTKAIDGDRLKLLTYHTTGLQTVNIISSSYKKSVDITAVNTWYSIDLPPSNELYRIEVPKGDLIINANNYFSFSDDSYFSTASVKVLPLQNRMDWLNKNKVDYVIVPSSNPSTGLYFYKSVTTKESNIRSPKSPWPDYTIDTWSAPNAFYFNPDKNNTWEYLIINNSEVGNIKNERIKYVSIQVQGDIGYRGDLYRVLHETPSEMILSKRLSDIDNKTLFLNREWQVGGVYTLTLKDVSGDGGSVALELNRSDKPVSRQIIPKGSKMFYNSSFNGKNVTIFQSELKDIFQEEATSFVKLSDVELYDENMTVIKEGESKGNETTYLSDVNNDGSLDIIVIPNRDLVIEKNSRKILFNSYLDFVVEDNVKAFYLERKITLPFAVINSSNIERESQYTLAPFLPAYNMMLTFPNFDVTAVSINATSPIAQIKVYLKELKNRPDNIIVSPNGIIYRYFSLSIITENIKNATVYFRVNRSWINRQNADSAPIILFKFNEGVWEPLPTYEENNDGSYSYYSAMIDDSSALFAIAASRELGEILPSQLQPVSDEQGDLLGDNKQTIESPAQIDGSGKNNNYNFLFLVLFASVIFAGYLIYKRLNLPENARIVSYLSRICSELFNSLLLTFLLLLLIENIWDNSVSKHINLNYLMSIVLIFGVLSLYGSGTKKEMDVSDRATRKEYITMIGIGLIGMIIIWSKIKYMGFISYPISIISGILIVLLSILMLEDNDMRDNILEE